MARVVAVVVVVVVVVDFYTPIVLIEHCVPIALSYVFSGNCVGSVAFPCVFLIILMFNPYFSRLQRFLKQKRILSAFALHPPATPSLRSPSKILKNGDPHGLTGLTFKAIWLHALYSDNVMLQKGIQVHKNENLEPKLYGLCLLLND